MAYIAGRPLFKDDSLFEEQIFTLTLFWGDLPHPSQNDTNKQHHPLIHVHF